jgi:hypothetical protein
MGGEMPWHLVTLALSHMDSGTVDRLLDELDEIFIAAENPKDAAVFSRISLEKKRCLYYFNPEAVRICSRLLLRWGGIACEEPGPDAVLLIGRPPSQRLQPI